MKILITGGAGFIGSAVVRTIIQNTNYKVVNVDKLTYAGNLNNLTDIENKPNYTFLYGDICNFIKLKEIFKNYPNDFENWHKYYNPIEVKYANDNINNMDKSIKDLFYLLSTNQLIEIFSKITGINDLEYDPYLHGAGLHSHPKYGRLNIHLDYEKHIILKNKQRRLNIILFLTKDWKKEKQLMNLKY